MKELSFICPRHASVLVNCHSVCVASNKHLQLINDVALLCVDLQDEQSNETVQIFLLLVVLVQSYRQYKIRSCSNASQMTYMYSAALLVQNAITAKRSDVYLISSNTR
jgi:hypothetical protein